jgi:hypothetical protein
MPSRAPLQNRIDPTQIPRPLPTGPEPFVFETRVDNQHQVPPPASSHYIVRDRGNCSPRFIRATINTVPATNDLLTTSAMPLALVVSPLALQDPADDPIQVRAAGGWRQPGLQDSRGRVRSLMHGVQWPPAAEHACARVECPVACWLQ